MTDDELVRQSIEQLLLVSKGERVMRPFVGSKVYAFVFENNDAVLGELIKAEISSVLGRFEPRAIVQDVQTTRNDTEVVVDVTYVVRSTGNENTLSMSFPTTTR